MANYYSLTHAAELSILDAIQNNITSSVTNITYSSGMNNIANAAPAIVAFVQQGEEIAPYTRCYNLHAKITIKVMAADTDTSALSTLAMDTFSLLMDPINSANLIKSYGGPYGFSTWFVRPINKTEYDDGDSIVYELDCDLVGALVDQS